MESCRDEAPQQVEHVSYGGSRCPPRSGQRGWWGTRSAGGHPSATPALHAWPVEFCLAQEAPSENTQLLISELLKIKVINLVLLALHTAKGPEAQTTQLHSTGISVSVIPEAIGFFPLLFFS